MKKKTIIAVLKLLRNASWHGDIETYSAIDVLGESMPQAWETREIKRAAEEADRYNRREHK